MNQFSVQDIPNIEPIIGKIRKLLALSASNNENEAQAAMMKAQEMLAKYKLTMRDVQDSKQLRKGFLQMKKSDSDLTVGKDCGSVYEGSSLFKIRFFDLRGKYCSDTDSFKIDQIGSRIKKFVQNVNNNSNDLAGFTIFELNHKEHVWRPYRNGNEEYTFDSGKRSDGQIHENLKRELPVGNVEHTPFNNLLIKSVRSDAKIKSRDCDPER